VGQVLERRGLIERDIESAWLAAARAGGFSLHAGLDIAPEQREKLERLCSYISRPPVATERVALTASGQVRYTLKTPYRDGTTHIVLEPLDLMARLAALVPPPRMHLTRFHGVFAPHSRLRAAVTPAHRGVGAASSQWLIRPSRRHRGTWRWGGRSGSSACSASRSTPANAAAARSGSSRASSSPRSSR
jgi:hypothetical protein